MSSISEKNQADILSIESLRPHAILYYLLKPREAAELSTLTSRALRAEEVIEINPESDLSIEHVRDIQKRAKIKKSTETPQLLNVYMSNGASIPAQNALLKTLEEPSSNTHLALYATDKNSVLKTIKSRSTEIDILPLAQDRIMSELRHKFPDEGDSSLRAHATINQYSFTTLQAKELDDFTDTKEFLSAKTAGRLNIVAGIKERNDAALFIDKLLLLASEAQSGAARSNKHNGVKSWSKLVDQALELKDAVAANANLKLQLQKLALNMPQMR